MCLETTIFPSTPFFSSVIWARTHWLVSHNVLQGESNMKQSKQWDNRIIHIQMNKASMKWNLIIWQHWRTFYCRVHSFPFFSSVITVYSNYYVLLQGAYFMHLDGVFVSLIYFLFTYQKKFTVYCNFFI